MTAIATPAAHIYTKLSSVLPSSRSCGECD